MNGTEIAVGLLPREWQSAAMRLAGDSAEEIRMRLDRPPSLLIGGKETAFSGEAVSADHLHRVLEKATGASFHAAASALSSGYVNYRGLRIGLCGSAVLRDGQVCGFRHISSLAIRIPRACRGICDAAVETICIGGYVNTLVIGRPGDGKTTALRELIRLLSERGYRVGVSDERNELAAAEGARAQFDLGPCCDVLTGFPKAEAAMMLLRGMNPQIIAMDEITQKDDLRSLTEVFGCGTGLLASAHASSLEDLRKRSLYRELLEHGLFTVLLRIIRTDGKREYVVERISG